MGHANLKNISQTVNRMLHKAPCGIRDIVNELERTKQKFHASEGLCDERYMLAMGVQHIIAVLYNEGLIEPVRLTAAQRRLFNQWERQEDDQWDSGDDGDGGECGAFDSIQWCPLKKRLPVIREFEN